MVEVRHTGLSFRMDEEKGARGMGEGRDLEKARVWSLLHLWCTPGITPFNSGAQLWINKQLHFSPQTCHLQWCKSGAEVKGALPALSGASRRGLRLGVCILAHAFVTVFSRFSNFCSIFRLTLASPPPPEQCWLISKVTTETLSWNLRKCVAC